MWTPLAGDSERVPEEVRSEYRKGTNGDPGKEEYLAWKPDGEGSRGVPSGAAVTMSWLSGQRIAEGK